MKLNDAVWGALLMVLAAAILIDIRGFPTIPGQQYGPALFPGVIAVGLVVCSVILIVRGLAARRTGGERMHWVALDAWTHSGRHVLALALTLGVNVLYILVADTVGFIPIGVFYLGLLFVVFGVRLRNAVPLALVITLVIHYAFYKLLRVPLPWGLLQGWSW